MCRCLAGVSGHHGGHSCRWRQCKRVGGLQEGVLEWLGPFPKQRHEPVSSHRCDESCLSCEGSSRNCSRCKTGFTLLGTTCITNHTCSNGEHQ